MDRDDRTRAGSQRATGTFSHWREIVAAARDSDDEHVIKGVHSCREQQAAYGGQAWQRDIRRTNATRALVFNRWRAKPPACCQLLSAQECFSHQRMDPPPP